MVNELNHICPSVASQSRSADLRSASVSSPMYSSSASNSMEITRSNWYLPKASLSLAGVAEIELE